MTMDKMKPTPKPAICRRHVSDSKITRSPEISYHSVCNPSPRPVTAVSRIPPNAKTTQPEMLVHLRPILSAISPAIIAPKNVPAERMEVVSDCWEAGMTKFCLSAALVG
jgi:hypothetical protein